jgi:hypothetical protein
MVSMDLKRFAFSGTSRRILFMALLTGLLLGGALAPGHGETRSKPDLLRDKLAAIEALRGQIGLKLIEASSIRSVLKRRIDPLELEIRTLCGQQRFSQFAESEGDPRIKFGLKTLVHLQGYYDAIREAISRLREADQTLQYLHQQIRDDLEVMATLTDFTIEALLTRINGALDFPEAHQAHLIDAARLTPPGPAEIFERLAKAP